MNREQFVSELEALLEGVPDKDKEDALAYYNDYFDAAGTLNEAALLEQLGSPASVAASIKSNLVEGQSFRAEYTESGYSNPDERKKDFLPPLRMGKSGQKIPIALVAIFLVFTAPIWGRILIFSFDFSYGLIFRILFAPLYCAAYGVSSIISGITQVGRDVAAALVTMGVGFIELAAAFGLGCIYKCLGTRLFPNFIEKLKCSALKITDKLRKGDRV